MLSSVLNNPRAIKVNLEIMRAFVRLRGMIASQKEVARKLAELEKHLQDHDEQIRTIFTAIRRLMAPKEAPKKRIGFQLKEQRAVYRARG
jgi:phage-related tail protein